MEPAARAAAEGRLIRPVVDVPAGGRAALEPPVAVVRLRQLAVCLLLTAVTFSQSPGLRANDTKLDLTVDPGRFLSRALHLWNPDIAFGQISNQGYGYLFPMGPFHLLGLSIGLPAWVVQRAWMSLLLVTAFLGCVRLAARLGMGTTTTRLLGGLAYALSPRVLTELGGISSELLPLVMLPWTVVPLVGPRARASPRRAAARSGVAVLLMGAVNATAALAVLPLPAVFVLSGVRTRSGRRLALWEAVCVGLAGLWWAGPLLLQGAYGLPFLNWIENAATTTRPTSLLSTFRGTSHWLAYLGTTIGPWWRSGWTLVTSPNVIVDSVVVAALGLVGLTSRDMPARRRLAVVAAVGLVAVTSGHVGPFSGPEGGAVRQLLDGTLAPFRNVHKFDPLLRLPLALGLAHLLGRGLPAARRGLAVVAGIALLGAATPAAAGLLVPAGGYAELPAYWQQTASWLDARADQGHALLVPGGSLGEYDWGRPLDEPLQALTRRTTWAVRDAVPLGSAGLTRLLDAVGARLDDGRGSAGLAPLLQRMGVRYVVVRNDLDRLATTAPRPVLVHQALAESPGLARVAHFGPALGGGAPVQGLVSDRGLDVRYPAVEVYAVGSTPVAAATAMAWAGTQVVSGGPESLLALADRGLLGPATVLAGDGPLVTAPRLVVTDGLRRREIAFGQGRENGTETLTRDAPIAVGQPVADFAVVPGEQHLTAAELIGARMITASSSASSPTARMHRTDRQPWSAFDGSSDTAWVSGAVSGAVGQWLKVDFGVPRDVAGTRLTVFDESDLGPPVSVVRVDTDRGRATTRLVRDGGAQVLTVPAGTTRRMRITVVSVAGKDVPGGLAGIRDIVVPGLALSRTLVVPTDSPTTVVGDPAYLFDRAEGARSGCAPAAARLVCSPDLARPGEEPVLLDRTFSVARAVVLPVGGTGRPVAGRALDDLLDQGAPGSVTASSVATTGPGGRPGVLLDGDAGTSWQASPLDARPEVTLRWPGARALDHLVMSPDVNASRPDRVSVDTGSRTVVVTAPPDGILRFPAVVTDHVTLRFRTVHELISVDPVTRQLARMPVGLSEIRIPGLAVPTRTTSATVQVPCGRGPYLALDGRAYPTSVLATRGDLLEQRRVLLGVCAPGPDVVLAAGQHRVVGGTRGAFQVDALTIGSPLRQAVPVVRTVEVRSWGAQRRSVQVAPGDPVWLVVHENANAGWSAELDGRRLVAARVDGWQQAWAIPAGRGGAVVLTYRPDRTFRLALLLGLLGVLLLLGLAAPLGRRRAVRVVPTDEEPASSGSGPTAQVVAGLVCLAVGGVWGLGAFGVGLLLVRRTGLAPAVAGGGVAAAGLLEALRPWASTSSPASAGAATQLLCLLAVGAAAASVSGRAAPTASSAALAPRPAAGSAPPSRS